MDMSVEERKNLYMQLLDELESELKILSNRITEAKAALEPLTTEEELKKFADNHDLENGLQHIELF